MKFLFRRRSNASEPASPADASPPPAIDDLIVDGNRLEDAGDVDGARKRYEEALAKAPNSSRAFLNLGNAFRLLGRLDEAADRYRRAIALQPDSAGAHLNLGNVLVALGDASAAADSYRGAIKLRPDWAEAWFGLGCALERLPSAHDAVEAHEKALALDPAHAMAAAALAALLVQQGDIDAARTVIDAALQRDPDNRHVLLVEADLARQMGDAGAAIAAYRKMLALDPNDTATWSAYLFSLNFDERLDAQAILAEHRRYGELLAAQIPRIRVRSAQNPDKRLRVGYLSPDFRRHSVSCFIEPLLRHHDRSAVEVHCYYNHATRDDITRRFMGLADVWHDIATLDDASIAQGIVDDGIDILVDLAGHTTGNRLGVFARKPAPLQYTWLGYLCTTGLAAIDYRLCDAQTDPTGIAEQWQVETPARLPNAQWCYQPQASVPDPSDLPRLRLGYWTFGSFNQAAKLNPDLLRHWAELVDAIPESRLRIVGVPNPSFAENIRAIFAERGIASDRLDLIGRIPIEDYFPTYRDVDIALDSFPYNGATTTCDALLMGVPVATVAGDRSISRGGVSLLSSVGLEQWIASSREDFVPMLMRRTQDPDDVAALRGALPEKMRSSALMDGTRFTRDIEKIYRSAWDAACRRTS